MKRLSIIFVVVATIFSLCGCYDSKEIDETAYIIALGIDKNENPGYNYTFQFSAPLATMSSEGSKGGASSEHGENPTVRNIVITAPDFYTAKNMTNNFLSKTVDMSHLKLIVFSASVGQEGFLNHSQFMLREREVRPHTAVALAETTSEEYLKAVNPELEANTAKHYELMSLRSNNVYSPIKRLSDFVDELNSENGSSVLPVACASGKLKDNIKSDNGQHWVGLKDTEIKSQRAEMRGMGIVRNGQPVGILDGDFAMLYNILKKDIKSCTVTLKNPHYDNLFLTFRLNILHPAEYSVDITKKPCRILVSQGFDIQFFGGGLPEGFSSFEELYDYADRVITKKISSYFYEISRNQRADIMKIGDRFKSKFLTNENWKSFNWENTFQAAEFGVNVYFS